MTLHHKANYLCIICSLMLLFVSKVTYGQIYVVAPIVLLQEEKVRTQKDIILRELSFQEGDRLAVHDWDSLMDWNEKRVFNLQLFNSCTIQYHFSNDSVWVQIAVSERFPVWVDPKFTLGDRNFNVWAKEHKYDFKRVNVGFRLAHLNIGGRRIQSAITLQAGYTQKYGLELAVPFLDAAKKHGLSWNAFYTSNKEVAVNTRDNKLFFHTDFGEAQYKEWSSEVVYSYRPNYAWQYKGGLKYIHHQVDDAVRRLNPAYLGRNRSKLDLLQASLRVEYNGVDNWNYPLIGQRTILQARFSHALQDPFHFAALHAQYDKYFSLSKRFYLATDIKAKWTYQNQYTYLYNRNLGYDNDYIRGYEYYVIDGHFMAFMRVDLKYELYNAQLKLPIKYLETFPIRLYPKLFADIGYSANRWNPTGLNHRAIYAVGLGIDIVTLYDIKVRLEFAYNHLKQYDLYLHRQGN